MSQLSNRLDSLERAAAQAAPCDRKTGWARMHANLRLAYGDGGTYTADELAKLDSVHPLAGIDLDALANGARDEPQSPS